MKYIEGEEAHVEENSEKMIRSSSSYCICSVDVCRLPEEETGAGHTPSFYSKSLLSIFLRQEEEEVNDGAASRHHLLLRLPYFLLILPLLVPFSGIHLTPSLSLFTNSS
ncbi:hypothetical protein MLD38_009105 [Melastoma candidum]|uniref:Uncharacterized protein n=1 Tax=Melastoma candidum TaxID=119954 RepID=A0ACB9RZJ4_9MYRT|nr:hypothetical protein MLD38_009105 [Melastoma candidum]